ncbi:hypothetical protein BKA93DRAFT_760178, partial [Sparassis latifolia]
LRCVNDTAVWASKGHTQNAAWWYNAVKEGVLYRRERKGARRGCVNAEET